MQYDKLHLIYFSPTHTSLTIALAIARGLGIEHITETDLTYETPETMVSIEQALTIIAVPVYGGRVAEIAMERLQKIRGIDVPIIPVVIYGNRDYEDALLELCNWSVEAGFIPVAGAAFIGEHSYSRADRPIAAGRPDEADRAVAFAFGEKVVQQLAAVDSLQEIVPPVVKGNVPYKEKKAKTPQTPVTIDALCTQCEYCIDICPTQAIRMQDEIVSDAELCIKCCACVKQCPNEARIFDTPYTDMLFKHFSVRREPELF